MAKIPPLFVVARLIVALWCVFAATLHAQIGGLDPGFAPGAILNGAVPGTVRAMIVQGDNKVIIAGDFTTIGGVARGRIARLNGNGSLDTTFATGAGADAPINGLSVQTDGNIVIGGEFTTFDGTGRNRIARLTTAGLLDTTFNPGTGANGTVNVVRASGTSIYLAGDFTQVRGSTRVRLARLDSAGALDSFMSGASGANAAIHALEVLSSNVYIGGAFTTFNGASRNRLAAISTSGFLNSSFNSSGGPDGTVYALQFNTSVFISSSAQLFIGGDFLNIGSVARSHLASLTVSTFGGGAYSVDLNFAIPTDAAVRCFVPFNSSVVGGTKLLMGGDFTRVSEQSRNHIARLTLTSTVPSSGSYWDVDTTFNPPAGVNGTVRAIGLALDEKPMIAGDFSSVTGATSQSVARLYSDIGSQPPSTPTSVTADAVSSTQIMVAYNGSTNATSYKFERSANGIDGWIVAGMYSGGTFTDAALTPGTPYFYRVTAQNSNGESVPSAVVGATTLATEWTGAGALDPAAAAGAGADSTVNAIAIQPDGAVLVAGSFTHVHGVARKYIARLLPDWTVDPAFDPGVGPDSTVSGLALQPNGKVVIVGSFSNVAGFPRKYVARLNANGTLDGTFSNPGNGPSSSVEFVGLQPSGRVIIAGSFSTVNGESHANIARLNANGTLDSTFTASTGQSVDAMSVSYDGRIALGGFFISGVNGASSKYVARLTADGAVDPTFQPPTLSAFINSVIALDDGRILVGGSFTAASGFRNRVLRLNSDGSLDAAFDPGAGPNGEVTNMAAQYDGKVLIGGSFTKVNGVTRPHIARLNANGTLDTTFQPGAGTSSSINAIAVADDTRIIIGGTFTTFGNGSRNRLARLTGDGVSAPPPVPVGLAASPVSASSLLISWSDVTGEQGWKLERSPDGLSNWTQVAAPPWDVTTITDTGLAPGTTYFYRLRSWNAAGDSGYSAGASARTFTLYQQWKVDRGFPPGSGDEGDGDGDGIPLIVEYGLGLDPFVTSTEGMPVYQIVGDVLALSYRKFRNDVNYSVEASTDMVVWSSGGVNQGSGAFPIAWKPINGEPQLFLRLRVTLP